MEIQYQIYLIGGNKMFKIDLIVWKLATMGNQNCTRKSLK